MERTEAKAVASQINSIGEISEGSYDAISSAKGAYDLLSEKDKESVSKEYQILLAAELAYNQIFADRVDNYILNIGEVNEGSFNAIEKADEEYEKLTKEQKKLVKYTMLLEEAKQQYDQIKAQTVIDLVNYLKNIEIDEENKIDEASRKYNELTAKQQEIVDVQVGSVSGAISKAKIRITEKTIDSIHYTKGEPTDENINELINAQSLYNGLTDEEKGQVVNYSNYEAQINNYKSYKEKKNKHDKVLLRNNYIEACEKVGYSEVQKSPISFKGKQVCFTIKISAIEDKILGDTVYALDISSSNEMILKDSRKIKEPKWSVGDEIIIYGMAKGNKTIKKYDAEGFMNIFKNPKEKVEIPIISVEYTDKDNIEESPDESRKRELEMQLDMLIE